MVVGYLAGAFDLLNVQDLDLLAQAGRRCDRLIVGVYSDREVEAVSGRPPVVPELERLELVRHLRGVSEAVVHDETRDLGEGIVAFAISNDPPLDVADETVLVPARYTQSEILRNALRLSNTADVA